MWRNMCNSGFSVMLVDSIYGVYPTSFFFLGNRGLWFFKTSDCTMIFSSSNHLPQTTLLWTEKPICLSCCLCCFQLLRSGVDLSIYHIHISLSRGLSPPPVKINALLPSSRKHWGPLTFSFDFRTVPHVHCGFSSMRKASSRSYRTVRAVDLFCWSPWSWALAIRLKLPAVNLA